MTYPRYTRRSFGVLVAAVALVAA
ncbi:MAG: hypothetical protein QOI36_3005, partial [Pseudonocardiales bacterium]|nr:hypothetical protein [Pseudonocardiales bacterium]